MKRTLVSFGRQFGIFSLTFFLAGASVAQNCGGKERWGPKDGTDPQARNIDLTNVTTKAVTNLVGFAVDPSRLDKYVGLLKRKKQ